ncbi:MAG: DUF3090 family protein, partial [Actinobacteria bacterium]|nr:DUF3090 family protein [Actinomycetota bacterium]
EDRVVALRCEKQHIAALAAHLDELFDDMAPTAPDSNSRSLREPVETTWVLGSLAFGYDPGIDRIIIIAAEASADGSGAQARFAITRAQAVSLIATTEELLAGSRPLCRLCGLAMNPSGHVCPRTNGHSAG